MKSVQRFLPYPKQLVKKANTRKRKTDVSPPK